MIDYEVSNKEENYNTVKEKDVDITDKLTGRWAIMEYDGEIKLFVEAIYKILFFTSYRWIDETDLELHTVKIHPIQGRCIAEDGKNVAWAWTATMDVNEEFDLPEAYQRINDNLDKKS